MARQHISQLGCTPEGQRRYAKGRRNGPSSMKWLLGHLLQRHRGIEFVPCLLCRWRARRVRGVDISGWAS